MGIHRNKTCEPKTCGLSHKWLLWHLHLLLLKLKHLLLAHPLLLLLCLHLSLLLLLLLLLHLPLLLLTCILGLITNHFEGPDTQGAKHKD